MSPESRCPSWPSWHDSTVAAQSRGCEAPGPPEGTRAPADGWASSRLARRSLISRCDPLAEATRSPGARKLAGGSRLTFSQFVLPLGQGSAPPPATDGQLTEGELGYGWSAQAHGRRGQAEGGPA